MENLMTDIFQSVKIKEQLKKLSNKKLGDLLLTHIWGIMNVASPESDLVEEIAERLKNIDTKPDCSEWHELNQDKDDTCPICMEPLNKDF